MHGVIVAGGRASRLGGGDKGERIVAGASILERVVAALRPQCDALVLNANGDPARFARLGLPIVADAAPDRLGPLAGVLAGLDHVAGVAPQARCILTVPGDAPFLPPDLVARLEAHRDAGGATIACARSKGRLHHVVALWPTSLRDDLHRFLAEGGRKVGAFAARHALVAVDWPDVPLDPFINVNTPADLAAAAELAALRRPDV